MSGLIISQLKDVSNDLTMTLDEESWFGKYLVHYRYTQFISNMNSYQKIPLKSNNAYQLFQPVYTLLEPLLEHLEGDFKLGILAER